MKLTVNKNELMVLLPLSLDYSHIEREGNEKIKDFDMNCIKFIIGRIIYSSVVFVKATETEKYNHHSVINSKTWIKHIGKNYLEYVQLLIDLKYINRKPYCAGKESFGYGFLKPLRFSRVFAEVIQIKNADDLKSNTTKTSYVKKYEKPLINFFDNAKFSIDTNLAENDVFEAYFMEGKFPIKISHGEPEKEALATYTYYLMAMKNMVKFMNGIYSFSRGSGKVGKEYRTVGRFYNPFARLNKEIRKYMFYDNKKIHEIDIKNSIPYFLSNYLSSIRYRVSKKRVDRIKDCFHIYMNSESLKTLMDREVEDFKNLCISGGVYDVFIDRLMEIYGEEWGKTYKRLFLVDYTNCYEKNRELTKKLLLSMFFAKNSQYEKVQQVFAERYPVIYDFLKTKKKQGYKKISKQLFEMEGFMIIDVLAKELIKDYRREIPVFPIHDSIATTSDHVEAVKSRFNEVFYQKYGNMPTLSIT